ncbi:EAL domain-containing protein [Methylomarinovum caldicuralii]|uniref:EAL domain-containing protein n=1 Tax=Methylomarinovum caldicuralii TaxID=438856 RepID=UPI002953A61A|nr:EAL domain-containing protein [Methylomarinovum caldicuralii]
MSDRVVRVAPDERPSLDELSGQTVFAVFEQASGCEIFLGLVTAAQVSARPGRIFADLLLQPPPPPLSADAPLEEGWRRLQKEQGGALAVIDSDGRFVGAVTPFSLLGAALRETRRLQAGIERQSARFRQRLDRLAEHTARLRRLREESKQLLSQAAETGLEQQLLQSALEHLVSLVGARYGALILLDADGKISDFLYTGIDPETAAAIGRLPTGKGLLGDFLLEKGVIRLTDMERHPRAAGFPPGHPPMHSLLAALIRCDGKVQGRVYLCDREDGEPFDCGDQRLVEEFADIMGMAVFLLRQRLLSHQQAVELKVATRVFENSAEGILVTDADKRIILVNRALITITGYSREELIGQTPRIFSSGHHGEDFYRQMWQSINATGQWQGEIWNRRKNGSVYPEWLRITAISDAEGEVTHYVAVFSDLSEYAVRRQGMERLIHYDHLTELPNRLMFRTELRQAIRRCHFNGRQMALLMLDLDRFKVINDTLGHQVGDRLLQQVSRRLQHCLRKREAPRMGDTVARLSGDEFTIILNDLEMPEDAITVAEKILARFRRPFVLGEIERSVTVSIGMVLYPAQAETLDELISRADMAMYHAKQAGRNRFCLYDPALHEGIQRRQMLENYLYNALERRQFEIHYQPQVSLRDGRIVGLEALLRWRHPEHGLINPAEFIPLLEETGLIEPVGVWVLQQVGRDYRQCLGALGETDFPVAVNVSARQLAPSLIGQVAAVLKDNALEPHCLKLELTESAAMDDPARTLSLFDSLQELGVGVCIDDFGTGYSSLAYLARLPIAALKIDRSFIGNMMTHTEDREVVSAIVALAHNLGIQVIAEGVETPSQWRALREMGCDVAQGYLCSRPVPLAQLADIDRTVWEV